MAIRSMIALTLACAAGLAACKADKPNAADRVATREAGNTMECISGAEKFSGKGSREVAIASLGSSDKELSFGVDLRVTRDSVRHTISSGLMAVPMRQSTTYFPDVDKEGGSLASYTTRAEDGEPIKDYNGLRYELVYSDKQIDEAAKLKLQIHKFAQTVALETGLPLYHIEGEYQFSAAYMPSNLPDACVLDAIKGATRGRFPKYHAGICKAEMKRFDCKFNVQFVGLPPS